MVGAPRFDSDALVDTVKIQGWKAVEAEAQRLSPTGRRKAVETHLHTPGLPYLPVKPPAAEPFALKTAVPDQVTWSVGDARRGDLGPELASADCIPLLEQEFQVVSLQVFPLQTGGHSG